MVMVRYQLTLLPLSLDVIRMPHAPFRSFQLFVLPAGPDLVSQDSQESINVTMFPTVS